MSTLVESPFAVNIKTEDETVAEFAFIQDAAYQALQDSRARFKFFSLSYEDVLNIYVQEWTKAGWDFSGMLPQSGFDQWVDQMESDFGLAYQQQYSGIPAF